MTGESEIFGIHLIIGCSSFVIKSCKLLIDAFNNEFNVYNGFEIISSDFSEHRAAYKFGASLHNN